MSGLAAAARLPVARRFVVLAVTALSLLAAGRILVAAISDVGVGGSLWPRSISVWFRAR